MRSQMTSARSFVDELELGPSSGEAAPSGVRVARCQPCRHERRVEIETEIDALRLAPNDLSFAFDDGGIFYDRQHPLWKIARRYRLNFTSLVRHIVHHPRAPIPPAIPAIEDARPDVGSDAAPEPTPPRLGEPSRSGDMYRDGKPANVVDDADELLDDSAVAEDLRDASAAAAAAPVRWTRDECIDGPRPCPRACRYRLDDAIESCALDVASRGPQKLIDIARLVGLSRERVRQIEVIALEKLQRRLMRTR